MAVTSAVLGCGAQARFVGAGCHGRLWSVNRHGHYRLRIGQEREEQPPLVGAYKTVSIDAAELFDKRKAFDRDLEQEEAKTEATWKVVLARYGLAAGPEGSVGQIHGP